MSQDANLRPCPFCNAIPLYESGMGFVFTGCKRPCPSFEDHPTREAWNSAHCWTLLDEKEKELAEERVRCKELWKALHAQREEIKSERQRKLSLMAALEDVLDRLGALSNITELVNVLGLTEDHAQEIMSLLQSPAADEKREGL